MTMLIGNSVLAITTSIFGQGATMPSVIANEFTEATEPFHLDVAVRRRRRSCCSSR